MKIIVNTKEFKTAMEKIFKVTEAKSYTPSLQNILLNTTAAERECYLSASNLEQFAKIKVYADSTENVSFGFSDTKALLKAMKFFTGDYITLEYTENSEITISCNGKKAQQATLKSDEFPEFPTLENEILNNFKYSNKKLKERFGAINYAVSADKNRKILQGICFKNSEMIACDGCRLALNKDDNLIINNSFVVSPAVLKNVNDILGEQLQIITNNKYIQFVNDENKNEIFISRLYDGEYLNYSKSIENRGEHEIKVNAKDYIDGLKYLKVFANDKPLVSWYNDKLGFKNNNGYFESELNINGNFDTEISFNGDYMMEALSQFKDEVKINIGTSISPIILTSEKDINNIALVVPVRPKHIFQEPA